jgi:hypothetical protein
VRLERQDPLRLIRLRRENSSEQTKAGNQICVRFRNRETRSEAVRCPASSDGDVVFKADGNTMEGTDDLARSTEMLVEGGCLSDSSVEEEVGQTYRGMLTVRPSER